jgi:hypothetical protein
MTMTSYKLILQESHRKSERTLSVKADLSINACVASGSDCIKLL